jgi:hypothetical protein
LPRAGRHRHFRGAVSRRPEVVRGGCIKKLLWKFCKEEKSKPPIRLLLVNQPATDDYPACESRS